MLQNLADGARAYFILIAVDALLFSIVITVGKAGGFWQTRGG